MIPVALGDLEAVNILLQGPLSTREGRIVRCSRWSSWAMVECEWLARVGVCDSLPTPALAWIESAALVAAYVDIFHVSESEKAS